MRRHRRIRDDRDEYYQNDRRYDDDRRDTRFGEEWNEEDDYYPGVRHVYHHNDPNPQKTDAGRTLNMLCWALLIWLIGPSVVTFLLFVFICGLVGC